MWGNKYINEINRLGSMDESLLEEMDVEDNETENLTTFFETTLETRYKEWAGKNPGQSREKAPWYSMVRGTLW